MIANKKLRLDIKCENKPVHCRNYTGTSRDGRTSEQCDHMKDEQRHKYVIHGRQQGRGMDSKDANFGTACVERSLTLLKYRRKIDVLPAPADPSTIALSRIGAPLPSLEAYGAAPVPPFIIGTSGLAGLCLVCSAGAKSKRNYQYWSQNLYNTSRVKNQSGSKYFCQTNT